MSVTKNQIIMIWTDVESCFRRSSYVRNGVGLTAEQGRIYSEALTLTCLAWHDKLSLLDGYSTRWMRPWTRLVQGLDLTSVVSCLKAADRLLLLSVEDDLRSLDRFKHDLRQEFPFSGDLLGPLSRALTGWLRDTEPASFDVAHTCLVFLSRLSLPGLKDLEEEAYADYLHNEDTLLLDGFTAEEEEIISKWFPVAATQELFSEWLPKHGPGSVADTRDRSLSSKYQAMAVDSRIHYLDLRLPADLGSWKPGGSSLQKLERKSVVVFVPKSIDKLRTICMEPTTLQWYQQGFLHSITSYLKRHRVLRRRISLEDQERSRDLAYEGSLSGYYATIDLSSASDRVSWSLVKQWTKTSALRDIALCSRSLYCELPGGAVIENKKFAPMGSALCFPFECIVFSAIVEAAITDAGGRTRSSNYCVYGDDIIVESIYADAVIRRLTRNGFLVNDKKSFVKVATHNFRESCGGEYLDGFDVSPKRLSRRFSGYTNLSTKTPSRILGCIDMCNEFYTALPSVRRRLVAAMNSLPQKLRPIFSLGGLLGVHSVEPTNHHLEEPVWNPDYQIWEVKHGTLTVTYSTDFRLADESARLYEHLRATYRRPRLLLPEDRVTIRMSLPEGQKWSGTRSQLPTYQSQGRPRNGEED